jgi:hypothetical protein
MPLKRRRLVSDRLLVGKIVPCNHLRRDSEIGFVQHPTGRRDKLRLMSHAIVALTFSVCASPITKQFAVPNADIGFSCCQ